MTKVTVWYDKSRGAFGTAQEHLAHYNANVFGFRFTLRDIRKYLVWAGLEVR